MNLRPLLVPTVLLIASAGIITWLFLADPPTTSRQQQAAHQGSEPRQTPGPSEFDPPPAVSEAERVTTPRVEGPTLTAVPLPSDIRNVSPEGVSAPEVVGTLVRVAPSQRYLELKDPPVEPIPDGPLELRRPQVLDAGTLMTKDLTVRLAHLRALPPDEICTSRLGGPWPCGARARTSLRGLVRMLTITCEKVEELGPREISATCKRRKINLGEWMVRHGWAEPDDAAPDHYQELAETARKEKKGKWQAEWIGKLNEPAKEITLPLDLPEAGLLEGNVPLNPFDLPEAGALEPTLEQDLLAPPAR